MEKKNAGSESRFVIQDLGSEVMLYDAQKDEVHILNQTARVIWEGVVAGKSPEELASELKERFSVGPDHDLLSDIRGVMEELKGKGLLKEVVDERHGESARKR